MSLTGWPFSKRAAWWNLQQPRRCLPTPAHPYTRRLISAVPVLTQDESDLRDRFMESLNA